jgi:hypothetical protein
MDRRLKDSNLQAMTPSIAAALHPGERVLWQGRPSPRVAIRGRLVVNVLVGGAFVALVVALAIRTGFGAQTPIYAVLLGLGLWQVARPLRFYLMAARTLYAVTDKRVLIVTGAKAAEQHSIAPEQIREVLIHAFRDGKGHVYLAPNRTGRRQVRYDRVGYRDGFWGIDDPSGAANAVRALQASLRS